MSNEACTRSPRLGLSGAAALVAALVVLPPGLAAAGPVSTDEVFGSYRVAVLSVVIIDKQSDSRTGYGSGFYVDAEGRAVTNYHVVAPVVHDPDAYRAEIHESHEPPRPLEVLAVDVINDLAVVRDPRQPQLYLELAPSEPGQGARLYSFGNPLELGPAVIEGTFNGRAERTFYDRYHLTGAINPGMSGGPTVDAAGGVIGVNVAYLRGHVVGFLVPVGHVRTLLSSTPVRERAGDASGQVQEQLIANQEGLAAWVLAHLETMPLGSYRLPKIDSPYIRCHGDHRPQNRGTFERTRYRCALESSIYVSSTHDTGTIALSHTLLSSERLNRFQFYTLYENEFSNDLPANHAGAEDVGSFSCRSSFVESGGLPLKVILCVRAYRKVPGLYDGALKVAVLAHDRAGLVTELRLAGFTAESIERISRRYIEAITWAP